MYCDNNPVVRVDEDGPVWQLALALAGGGTMATGSLAAGLGAITPAGWAVIIAIAVVGIATIGIRYTKEKSRKKSKEEVDPYGRPGQKKQGREVKKKARRGSKFKSRNNRRDKKPAHIKKHTPSRKGHTKYYPS